MSAEVVGILLAAGASSRFGADKLLHPLPGGVPLVVAAARNLVGVLPASIAVVRPDASELADRLSECGLVLVVNPRAGDGMGASIASGVSAAAGARGWIVALGDMPWVRPGTVARIVDALDGGASIVRPAYRGRAGHPVGFSRAHFPALAGLRGAAGARSVVDAAITGKLLLDVDDPGVLRDVDRRADLKAERVQVGSSTDADDGPGHFGESL